MAMRNPFRKQEEETPSRHYRCDIRIYDPTSDNSINKWGGRITCHCGVTLGEGSPYAGTEYATGRPWLEAETLFRLTTHMQKLWAQHRGEVGAGEDKINSDAG